MTEEAKVDPGFKFLQTFAMVQVIDVVVKRGAINGDEMVLVGKL